MSLTSHLREIFRMHWPFKPVSDHEAGQVLARKAAEARTRAALTLREKQDALNARLRAERDEGRVCGRLVR